MAKWEQTGGDMNPADYNGIFTKYDTKFQAVEVGEVMNAEDAAGREALEDDISYFLSVGYYDFDELDDPAKMEQILEQSGWSSPEEVLGPSPSIKNKRILVAQELFMYGEGRENPDVGGAIRGTFGEAVEVVTGEDPQKVKYWSPSTKEDDLGRDPVTEMLEFEAGE